MQALPAHNQPSAVEMGFSSITSLLSEIANNTGTANRILDSIHGIALDIFQTISASVGNFINPSSKTSISSDSNIKFAVFDIRDAVFTITDGLLELRDGFIGNKGFLKDLMSDIVKVAIGGGDSTGIESLIETTNIILLDIKYAVDGLLNQIYNVITAIHDIDFTGAKPRSEKEAKLKGNEFLNLAKSLKAFKNIITKDFIQNFERFILTFNNFLDIDTKKITNISVVLLTITSIFNIIAFQVGKMAKAFRSLAIAILLVSFMMLSPLFILGAGVLVGIIWTISKVLGKGDAKDKNTMLYAFGKFSMGILFLTVALFAVSKVPFDAVLKLIVLIVALGTVIKQFIGEGESSLSITKAGLSKKKSGGSIYGMISFAIGMNFLVYAMVLINLVPWSATLKLIAFILSLGIIFKMFYSGNVVTGKQPSMAGFGFGMALIVLALHGFGEIQWGTVFKFLLFLGVLGSLLQFIKPRRSILPFAFAMAVLVLALFALGEVPVTSLMLMVGFIAAISFVMSKYPITANIKLSGLAASILMMGFSFALISSSNMQFKTLAMFIGMLVVFIGIVVLLGLPKVSLLVKSGSLALASMAGAVFLATLIFTFLTPLLPLALIGAIGAIPLMGMFLVIATLLAVMLVPAIFGTIAAIALMLMGAFLLAAISIFTFIGPFAAMALLGVGAIILFIGLLWKPIWTLTLMTVPLIVATIGAILLTVFAAMLLTSLTLITVMAPLALVAYGAVWATVKVFPGLALLAFLLIGFSVVGPLAWIGAFFLNGIIKRAYTITKNLTKINEFGNKPFLATLKLIIVVTGLLAVGTMLTVFAVFAIPAVIASRFILVLTKRMLKIVERLSDILSSINKMPKDVDIEENFITPLESLIKGFATLVIWAAIGKVSSKLVRRFLVSAHESAILLDKISEVKVSKKSIKNYVKNLETLITGISGYKTTDLIKGALKANLLLPILRVSHFGAKILGKISEVDISKKSIKNYVKNLETLITGISGYKTSNLIKGALKANLLLPILWVSHFVAKTFGKISEIEIDKSKIVSFGELMKFFIDEITETIADSSSKLKDVRKGTRSLRKIINVAADLAKVIKEFSDLNFNEYHVVNGEIKIKAVHKITDKEIKQVGVNIGTLLQGLMRPLAIISSDSKQWDFGDGVKVDNPFTGGWFGRDKKSGVKRLASIGGAFTPLVEIVKGFSNMTFNEYEVVNGEVRVKKVHPISDADLLKIGHNIGKLLQGLTNPLSVLSSDDEYWDFGGADGRMINPFGKKGFFGGPGNKVGIERIKLIGEAFLPLSETIKNLSENDILQNETKIQKLNSGLIVVTDSFTTVFGTLSQLPKKNVKTSVENLVEFGDSIERFNVDKLSAFSDAMGKFVDVFSDTDKWGQINKNLKNVSESFKDISKHINSIDLERALAIERSINSLSNTGSENKLDEIITKLEELIHTINSKTNISQTVENEKILGKSDSSYKTTDIIPDETEAIKQAESILAVLRDIADSGKITSQRLAGKLRVVNIENQTNTI